jgi:transposase
VATERLTMRNAREILRTKWELGLSNREAARSTGSSAGSVDKVLKRARSAGLTSFAEVAALSDDELMARLYSEPQSGGVASARPEPDCAWIHRERSRPGVTLDLLHQEYLVQHPGGYQYTAFCDRYREFLKRRGMVMRQPHIAGDKMLVDYSGKRPHIVDVRTGEVIAVELFVAVLGASNYTYAEATRTQQVPDFVGSHARAFAFFGGVSRAVVPDNLKSAIVRACRYEPELQRSYEHMAQHYGTAIVPARPHKPRDKAKVEVAVQIAQRFILARLRDRVFHTLAALNEAMWELLDQLNARTMRTYGKSRRELFESLERATLLPLPTDRFELTEWKKAKVNIDYHVVFRERLYSVPSRYVHEDVWVCATANSVEVQLRGRRIALHARGGNGRYATLREHMPSAHRAHAEWTPSRILSVAEHVGPATHALCTAILADRPHPEQGFRSCLGIVRLCKRYGDARVESACARSLSVRGRSYRSVESMLRSGLDKVPIANADESAAATAEHENIRGRDYYTN